MKALTLHQKNAYLLSTIFLIGIITYYFILGIDTMSHTWAYPFFSGAEYIFKEWQWLINTEQLDAFYQISKSEVVTYNFSYDPDNKVPYQYNAVGYVYIIAFASLIFSFLSNVEAIILLQVFVHIIMTSYILFRMSQKKWQWAFLFLYGLNPVVLKFVFYGFYYFWQVIPAFILVVAAINKVRSQVFVWGAVVILILSTLLRPTILPLCVFSTIFIGVKYYKYWYKGLGVALIYISLTYCLKDGVNQGPWHTMYVGLGAYQGINNIPLSDEAGYDYFESSTGVELINTLPDGNFYLPEFRQDYYRVLRNAYIQVLEDAPLHLAINAVKNTLSSYSVGYFVGNSLLQNLAIMGGLLLVVLLLKFRFYFYFLAIGFSSAAFVLYYPPIPAYMYGSYLLIVLAVLSILNHLVKKKDNESTLFRSW